MKKVNYQNRIKWLGAGFALVTIITSGSIFFASGSFLASVITFFGLLFADFLALWLHRMDNRYISDIVCDLSRLTDSLTELSEQEIFPENEDTLVSKLQSKVIKLARILKKKNAIALQNQENIKSLVSDISHQLKTPIANLKMYSQFLQEDNLSVEKRKEYMEILQLSVERLNFLSERMIKISRLESGLIHLDMQEQSLNETVLKAVKDVYVKAKEKETEIIYREDKNIVLRHDRNWTSEAVFNLLDNAVKYSVRGSQVILSVRELGMFVEVVVEDENEPIPDEEQARIFGRFCRGSNSSGCEGIGVGLYLAREISLKQGGYMGLKTKAHGNIFSFVLQNR